MKDEKLAEIQSALNKIYSFKLREIEELLDPLPVGLPSAGGTYHVYRKMLEFRAEVEQKMREVNMMRQLNKAYSSDDFGKERH